MVIFFKEELWEVLKCRRISDQFRKYIFYYSLLFIVKIFAKKLKGHEEQSYISIEQERIRASQVDQNNRIRNRRESRVHPNRTLCFLDKKRSVDKHFGRGIEGFGEKRKSQGAVRARQEKDPKESS